MTWDSCVVSLNLIFNNFNLAFTLIFTFPKVKILLNCLSEEGKIREEVQNC